MITVVDYGMGNLGSIKNMFKRIGAKTTIESDPDKINKANKILLPGVGSFDMAMQKIRANNLEEVLNYKAKKEKIPVLGICLGMQILTDSSEEGNERGLGWIPAKTLSFKSRIKNTLKIPHMGWNTVNIISENHLFRQFDKLDEIRFYFVHSYFVECSNNKNILSITSYDKYFHSGIYKDNIYGLQFHPEKSHKFGMKIFENFARL